MTDQERMLKPILGAEFKGKYSIDSITIHGLKIASTIVAVMMLLLTIIALSSQDNKSMAIYSIMILVLSVVSFVILKFKVKNPVVEVKITVEHIEEGTVKFKLQYIDKKGEYVESLISSHGAVWYPETDTIKFVDTDKGELTFQADKIEAKKFKQYKISVFSNM